MSTQAEPLFVYGNNPELRAMHILEQYKIYVEMADKISERRNNSNIFFLTLNTAALSSFGFFLDKLYLVTPNWLLAFPGLSLILLCYVWYSIIKSYRQLNTAKYIVVGILEKELPTSPYWNLEWAELGEGKDSSKYTPLTYTEQFVPIIFGVLYFMFFVYLIVFY